MNHNGLHLVDSSAYRGLVCIECAPKINKRRQNICIAVFAFAVLALILLFVWIIIADFSEEEYPDDPDNPVDPVDPTNPEDPTTL